MKGLIRLKRIKYLMIGLLAGMLLATAGTSLAAELIEKVTASVRTDFKLEMDGKHIELENAPLAYNGASYLPVRELADILGKDVDFKDNVITLDTPKGDEQQMDEDFISLYDLANTYGVSVTNAGNEMAIGEYSFETPKESTTIEVNDSVKFDITLINYRFYVKESQMRDIGVIQ